jgi:hypothetical protein
MTAAAWVFAVAAAVMFGYGPAFCLSVWLAERRDRTAADQQPEPEPANPMLTHPSLRTHQTVARTYDLIAANEATRLDDEWATVAKEWSL